MKSKLIMKICRRCKAAKVKANWTCRDCGALCCEHLCGLKSMSGGGAGKIIALASCSTCRLRTCNFGRARAHT